MLEDKVTPTESIWVGAITGAIDVTTNLPLWTIKTRVQCSLPFTLNPLVLYRGYTIALSVTTLLTASQILSSTLIEQALPQQKTKSTSASMQRVMSSFLGGAFSSIIFGPIDLVSTQYHQHGYLSYMQAMMKTIHKLGTKGLFIGTPATAIADGVFVSAYYGCYPLIKNKINSYIHHPLSSALLSTGITGVAAATASHIPDMIKTLQQKNAHIAPKSIRQSFYELAAKKDGVGFFKGYLPRTLCMVSAVGIAGTTAETVENLMIKCRKI